MVEPNGVSSDVAPRHGSIRDFCLFTIRKLAHATLLSVVSVLSRIHSFSIYRWSVSIS